MKGNDELDTDTLLAMLESMFEPRCTYNRAQLLDVLLEAEGDIDLAFGMLSGQGSSKFIKTRTPSKKRTANGHLDKWLDPTSKTKKAKKSNNIPDNIDIIEIQDEEPVHAGSSEAALPTVTKLEQSPGMTTVDQRRNGWEPSPKSEATHKPSAFDLLRPPPPSEPPVPRLAPITLGTPELVARHTPTTIYSSVLPQELACRLFYALLDESEQTWRRSKWHIVDKIVESPHLTSFYVRDGGSQQWNEAAQYWYNGSPTDPPPQFPPEMEEACRYVEQIVNDQLKERKIRYPLEWGGESGWSANVAAANRYKGAKEGVGFHSDQLTYLGPYPTIASLSLGTTRIFRLRETIPRAEKSVKAAQTFNISLPHNSLLIMHPPCQEHFKHTIPILNTGTDLFRPPLPRPTDDPEDPPRGYNERINVTFRFYRPDFAPHTTPRCKCGVPTVLRANQKGSKTKERDTSQATQDAGMRYFWMCYAGAQNDGKGCGYLKVLDMSDEGRGPVVESMSY